jgi:hypothetical protein
MQIRMLPPMTLNPARNLTMTDELYALRYCQKFRAYMDVQFPGWDTWEDDKLRRATYYWRNTGAVPPELAWPWPYNWRTIEDLPLELKLSLAVIYERAEGDPTDQAQHLQYAILGVTRAMARNPRAPWRGVAAQLSFIRLSLSLWTKADLLPAASRVLQRYVDALDRDHPIWPVPPDPAPSPHQPAPAPPIPGAAPSPAPDDSGADSA